MQVGAAPGLAGYSAPPPRDIPLRVQVAFSIYHTIASRSAVAVASSHPGDAQKDPKLSAAEEKTRDTALGIITRYMSGEHDYEDKDKASDFARAGMCDFHQLPPVIQMQLRTSFPPGFHMGPQAAPPEPQAPAEPPAIEPPGPPTASDVQGFIDRAQPRPPDDPGAAAPAVPTAPG